MNPGGFFAFNLEESRLGLCCLVLQTGHAGWVICLNFSQSNPMRDPKYGVMRTGRKTMKLSFGKLEVPIGSKTNERAILTWS